MLIEGEAKESGFLTGKTATLKRVKIPALKTAHALHGGPEGAAVDLRPGDYAAVRISGNSTGLLFGEAIARTSVQEFVDCYGHVVPRDEGLGSEALAGSH